MLPNSQISSQLTANLGLLSDGLSAVNSAGIQDISRDRRGHLGILDTTIRQQNNVTLTTIELQYSHKEKDLDANYLDLSLGLI